VSIPADTANLKKMKYKKMIDVGTRNIVARSRNNFCHEKIIVYSLRISVDLYVAVSSIRCSVLPINATCFYCTVVELRNISYCCQQHKCTWVFMQSAPYCCPIFTRSGFQRQIFVNISNIIFFGNPFSGGCEYIYENRRKVRQDTAVICSVQEHMISGLHREVNEICAA
jgi:hypothetical protein